MSLPSLIYSPVQEMGWIRHSRREGLKGRSILRLLWGFGSKHLRDMKAYVVVNIPGEQKAGCQRDSCQYSYRHV